MEWNGETGKKMLASDGWHTHYTHRERYSNFQSIVNLFPISSIGLLFVSAPHNNDIPALNELTHFILCDISPISFWSHFYTILDYIFIDTLIEVYLNNSIAIIRFFLPTPPPAASPLSSFPLQCKHKYNFTKANDF